MDVDTRDGAGKSIWLTVWQRPIVLAVVASGGVFRLFVSFAYHFTFLSTSFVDGYCLKGPLNLNSQQTNR